jgi:hypothetical protein
MENAYGGGADMAWRPFALPWSVSHSVNYARALPQVLTDGDLKMAFGEEPYGAVAALQTRLKYASTWTRASARFSCTVWRMRFALAPRKVRLRPM